MTDEKRRTLRFWAECEKDLSFPSDNLGALIGWADAMVELQILKELEGKDSLC